MRISPMLPQHLPAVEEIERQCFSLPWSLRAFAEELENPSAYYITALEESRVAGYAGMRFVLDEYYIDNIAVAPDCRRRGIGKALVRSLAARAAAGNARFLTLEVRPSNRPAVCLYRQMGFVQTGLRKNFYEAPREDGAVMTLFFQDAKDRSE